MVMLPPSPCADVPAEIVAPSIRFSLEALMVIFPAFPSPVVLAIKLEFDKLRVSEMFKVISPASKLVWVLV